MKIENKVLYFFSSILIIFGIVGTGISVYTSVYSQAQIAVHNISNQLILASQILRPLVNEPILGKTISNQINETNTNLNLLNTNISEARSHFQSLGAEFNICILGVCPFNSVSGLFYSLANTTNSASITLSSFSSTLESFKNLNLSDYLTSQQISTINSTSNQLYSIGVTIRQTVQLLPVLMFYMIALNLMFILIGLSVFIITRKLIFVEKKLGKR